MDDLATPDPKEITIRLQDEGSLSELAYGVWGSLFWIVDNGDGTYSLFGGGAAVTPAGEAYMRVMLEKAYEDYEGDADADRLRLPPAAQSEPTVQVKVWMEQIKERLGWGDPKTIVRCDR